MSHVGVDLFDFSGKKYVVCVDKWSGYPVYKRLQTVTTKALISVLKDWFNVLGWPSHLRSDGGPQFLGPFREWCKNNNILHEVSSPYNPKGNGLAEAAVKNVKNILAKCASTGQSPIWSEWRLTVIAATVRIALVDILDLSEVDIPAGGFLYPAVGWG